ncbi:hypothetical protein [Photorhabdus temperata]|uniref:hypothetical protein n=1 Tax=Photorhabdus temperata TaxID=574560 RepID=UPI000403DBA4|nr:hypothetical protein [Photorhabdus temperata]
MIEFKNLSVLQNASLQIQEQVRNEGKLQIAGREYHINADLQQVLRTHPKK